MKKAQEIGPPQAEINTFNKYGIYSSASGLGMISPPCEPMSMDDALVLAAWLVVLVGDDSRWAAVRAAVEAT